MSGAFVVLPIRLKMPAFALPSLSKVRRMGGAHPHARNYKRWATHKASMRASCGSIEKELYPLTIYKYNIGYYVGTLSQTLPKALSLETVSFLKKAQPKTSVFVSGQTLYKTKMPAKAGIRTTVFI